MIRYCNEYDEKINQPNRSGNKTTNSDDKGKEELNDEENNSDHPNSNLEINSDLLINLANNPLLFSAILKLSPRLIKCNTYYFQSELLLKEEKKEENKEENKENKENKESLSFLEKIINGICDLSDENKLQAINLCFQAINEKNKKNQRDFQKENKGRVASLHMETSLSFLTDLIDLGFLGNISFKKICDHLSHIYPTLEYKDKSFNDCSVLNKFIFNSLSMLYNKGKYSNLSTCLKKLILSINKLLLPQQSNESRINQAFTTLESVLDKNDMIYYCTSEDFFEILNSMGSCPRARSLRIKMLKCYLNLSTGENKNGEDPKQQGDDKGKFNPSVDQKKKYLVDHLSVMYPDEVKLIYEDCIDDDNNLKEQYLTKIPDFVACLPNQDSTFFYNKYKEKINKLEPLQKKDFFLKLIIQITSCSQKKLKGPQSANKSTNENWITYFHERITHLNDILQRFLNGCADGLMDISWLEEALYSCDVGSEQKSEKNSNENRVFKPEIFKILFLNSSGSLLDKYQDLINVNQLTDWIDDLYKSKSRAVSDQDKAELIAPNSNLFKMYKKIAAKSDENTKNKIEGFISRHLKDHNEIANLIFSSVSFNQFTERSLQFAFAWQPILFTRSYRSFLNNEKTMKLIEKTIGDIANIKKSAESNFSSNDLSMYYSALANMIMHLFSLDKMALKSKNRARSRSRSNSVQDQIDSELTKKLSTDLLTGLLNHCTHEYQSTSAIVDAVTAFSLTDSLTKQDISKVFLDEKNKIRYEKISQKLAECLLSSKRTSSFINELKVENNILHANILLAHYNTYNEGNIPASNNKKDFIKAIKTKINAAFLKNLLSNYPKQAINVGLQPKQGPYNGVEKIVKMLKKRWIHKQLSSSDVCEILIKNQDLPRHILELITKKLEERDIIKACAKYSEAPSWLNLVLHKVSVDRMGSHLEQIEFPKEKSLNEMRPINRGEALRATGFIYEAKFKKRENLEKSNNPFKRLYCKIVSRELYTEKFSSSLRESQQLQNNWDVHHQESKIFFKGNSKDGFKDTDSFQLTKNKNISKLWVDKTDVYMTAEQKKRYDLKKQKISEYRATLQTQNKDAYKELREWKDGKMQPGPMGFYHGASKENSEIKFFSKSKNNAVDSLVSDEKLKKKLEKSRQKDCKKYKKIQSTRLFKKH